MRWTARPLSPRQLMAAVLVACGEFIDGYDLLVMGFITSSNDFFFALILTRTNATTARGRDRQFHAVCRLDWGKIAAAGSCNADAGC